MIDKMGREYKRWPPGHIAKTDAERTADWRKGHPDEAKVSNRMAKYLKRYNITLDEYDELFELQGGVCAICRNTNGNRRLAVDHDHITGRVRGLLCTSCNIGIGQFEDNPELIARAISYLMEA